MSYSNLPLRYTTGEIAGVGMGLAHLIRPSVFPLDGIVSGIAIGYVCGLAFEVVRAVASYSKPKDPTFAQLAQERRDLEQRAREGKGSQTTRLFH
jgi:hypothetical protein